MVISLVTQVSETNEMKMTNMKEDLLTHQFEYVVWDCKILTEYIVWWEDAYLKGLFNFKEFISGLRAVNIT